jgi:uncharacterized membrane protein YhfC
MRASLVSLGFLLLVVGIVLMALQIGYFGEFTILKRKFTVDTFSLTVGGLIIFAVGLALPGGPSVVILTQKPKVKIRTVVACPSCGKFVSRRAKHCPNCGRRLKP